MSDRPREFEIGRRALAVFFDLPYLRRAFRQRHPGKALPSEITEGRDLDLARNAFLMHGGTWDVVPTPLFDRDHYLERNPDVAAAGDPPFLHFLAHGLGEGRSFHPEIALPPISSDGLGPEGLFGPAPDMPIAPMLATAAERFGPPPGYETQLAVLSGTLVAIQGSQPAARQLLWLLGALVDPDVAALTHPDLPLWEVIRKLVAEDRSAEVPGVYFGGTLTALADLASRSAEKSDRYWTPGPRLNMRFYEAVNADLRAWPSDLLLHFLAHGQFENRVVNALIDPAWYLWRHPEARDMSVMKHLVLASHRGEEVRPNGSCMSPVELAVLAGGSMSPARALDLIAEAYDACLRDSGFAEDESSVIAQMNRAAALDPMIRPVLPRRQILPKPYDQPMLPAAIAYRETIGRRDVIVLRDHISMGGADRVAGEAIRALVTAGLKVTVLSTMRDGVAGDPAHYPERTQIVDFGSASRHLSDVQMEELLYDVIVGSGARAVLNINSRLGWETTLAFGPQLSQGARLLAYVFCDDRDEWGNVAGYPSRYIVPAMAHLDAVITDTDSLRRDLAGRIGGPVSLTGRLHWLRTPVRAVPSVHKSSPDEEEPLRIAWAGRFDRQKRFDLVIDLAQSMPEAEFLVWGRPVLNDYRFNEEDLPENIRLMGLYQDFSEIVAERISVFLYTALWDGAPTILLDAVAAGLPIVASAAGGVSECLPAGHPHLVDPEAEAREYRSALLKAARSDPVALAESYRAVLDRRQEAEFDKNLLDIVQP